MVNIETACREQDVTYWSFAGYDSNGQAKVNSPIDIKARWVENSEEIIGPDATPITTDGTLVVNIEIAEGSLVRLGTVANLPDPVVGGLMEVVGFRRTPDIKNRSNRRVANFKKYKDTLAEVV